MKQLDFSVWFPLPEKLSYPVEKLERMFITILRQTDLPKAIYIFNRQDNDALADKLFSLAEKAGIACEIIPAKNQFLTACAHVLAKMATPFYVYIQNDAAPVYFRQSAFSLFSWAATRTPQTGLFYAEYDLIDPVGSKKEVHLLQFHSGRLRDNMDFGRVLFINAEAARQVGGFTAQYKHGYLYDFRLKIAANHDLTLISNRYNGSLYQVEDVGTSHNVFDYLLSSKEVQLEMENIVTAHLRRIGAYLAPDGSKHPVKYTTKEEKYFQDCLASIIIPVNNRPQFIGTAIESVLTQTVQQVEVIVVVNGGENDPTIAAVKEYQPGGKKYDPAHPPVRLLVHDINNIGLCLNEGLQVARGKFYVQLDSDDRLKPFAVAKLLELFAADSHIGMAIGSYEVWQKEEDGRFFRREDIPVVTHDEWTEDNGRNNLLRINGAGAPRSAHIKVLREMGWFSINDAPFSRNYGEDYEMVLKVSEKYRIGRIWEPIYEVVRHSGGTDHAIDLETIHRNDNAKDHMRQEAILRRQKLNHKKA